MAELSSQAVIEKVLADYVQEAERVFRREIMANGKVLTGELLASVRAGAVVRGQGFIEGHVHYSALLRIKDMRTLHFTTVPPLAAMVNFVEKVGPDKFPKVYGYANGGRPKTYTATVYRIAASLQMHFKREPNVKRGYRGLYNDPLRHEILPRLYADLRQHAGAYSHSTFREIFA